MEGRSVRLHSAIGCITLNDFLAGNQNAIWDKHDRELEAPRETRRLRSEPVVIDAVKGLPAKLHTNLADTEVAVATHAKARKLARTRPESIAPGPKVPPTR